MAARGLLPNKAVDSLCRFCLVLLGKRRAGQQWIQVIQNEHLDLGLGLRLPGPLIERGDQFAQRRQQIAAGFLEAFAVGFADVLFA